MPQIGGLLLGLLPGSSRWVTSWVCLAYAEVFSSYHKLKTAKHTNKKRFFEGLIKTGALEHHPVWGFKNIKGGGVGVVGREA